MTLFGGTPVGEQYFAGYLTEKALSVDNLFVFLVIIANSPLHTLTNRRYCSSASCSR